MQAQIVNRLLALNREFYAAFAHEFSATRSSERINLNPIAPYLFNGARVLDIGCGNGRMAERLDREEHHIIYLGIDVTPPLIEIAHARESQLHHIAAEFRVADISARGWTEALRERAPFDVILALAVLHHIPSFDLRRAVLRDSHDLLKPGGVLMLSNWQFTSNARLRKKIASWQTLGIEEREVEPGDALLDWKRGGTGYRYVHLLDMAEVESLAAQSGFTLLEQFFADADLNLWSVLKRAQRRETFGC